MIIFFVQKQKQIPTRGVAGHSGVRALHPDFLDTWRSAELDNVLEIHVILDQPKISVETVP